MAPHIILEELQLPFSTQSVKLGAHDPEITKMNPLGAVPTLVTDKSEVLTENAVILQYLGDLKPELNLIPAAGSWERVRLQETLNFIASELHKTFGSFFHLDEMIEDPAARKELRNYFTRKTEQRLEIAAQKVGEGPFLFGNQFTVADAYLFTILTWAPKVGVDLAKYPQLTAYVERVGALASVKRAQEAEAHPEREAEKTDVKGPARPFVEGGRPR